VSVCDGTGRELMASLATASGVRVVARVVSEMPPVPGSRISLTLAQVVPRGARMDLIVAKATELGVDRIVPLGGERSAAAPAARVGRWLRIAQEAAEQCGRRQLPALSPPSSLDAFLRALAPGTPLVACDAGEGRRPLLAACQELRGTSALTLVVGAEGGLSPAELTRLQECGARLVGLGPRLLRAETAALAALIIIQATLGDWDMAWGPPAAAPRPGGGESGSAAPEPGQDLGWPAF